MRVNVIILAVLFVALLVHAARYWLGERPRQLAVTYRYRLYAVRDKMIRAVAEGRVSESDPTFRFLYRTVNKILPRCRPLGLSELLGVFGSSSINENLEWREKFNAATHHPDPEVRSAAHELIVAIIDILLLKSPCVRLGVVDLLIFRKRLSALRVVRRLLPQAGALDLYKELDHLRRAA